MLLGLRVRVVVGEPISGCFRRRMRALLAALVVVSLLEVTDAFAAFPPAALPASEEAVANGRVSFASELAGLLSERCVRCHGDSRRTRADLDLTTYAELSEGGDSGPAVVAGDAENSLLIQKIRGTADGQRMPVGGPPLEDDVIDLFARWVEQGAKFDGPDDEQHVRQLATLAWAEEASHEELRERRAEMAAKNWDLVMPDRDPQQLETEHFLLLGNIDERRFNEAAQVAEKQVPRLKRLLRVPRGGPWVKGAITLYLFQTAYDYGEMGRMVEQRGLPPGRRGHSRYSIIDAYAAFHVRDMETASWEARLIEQLAAIYAASLGNAPAWFRSGVGRSAAARLEPRSDLVRGWREAADAAFLRLDEPQDFLEKNSMSADGELLAYRYVSFLMDNSRRFGRLLNELRDGTDFQASFAQAYGGRPEQVARLWMRREAIEVRRRAARRR